jgi:hypothetical protein
MRELKGEVREYQQQLKNLTKHFDDENAATDEKVKSMQAIIKTVMQRLAAVEENNERLERRINLVAVLYVLCLLCLVFKVYTGVERVRRFPPAAEEEDAAEFVDALDVVEDDEEHAERPAIEASEEDDHVADDVVGKTEDGEQDK